MKKDYKPVATNAKTIACTGDKVTATVVLDQNQGKAGTLSTTHAEVGMRQRLPADGHERRHHRVGQRQHP
jgi:hypothetical protein